MNIHTEHIIIVEIVKSENPNNTWVQYSYAENPEMMGGAIHSSHFPKFPIVGEKYVVALKGFMVKSIIAE